MVTWNKEEPVIHIPKPKKPKKITGTRFAGVLGLNPWASPFSVWCAITRTYEDPFVENKYTTAGTAIEPIVLKYLNDVWFPGQVVTAEEVYGKNPFKKTRGDFFPLDPIFGGMWDALLTDDDGNLIAVIEVKTTSRIDKWEHGAPDYQALQGALYANRKGVDRVIMVVAVLEESDYENPKGFKPTSSNIIVDDFIIEERYPGFAGSIAIAEEWWANHVETGISPYYNDRLKGDKEILAILKTTFVDVEDEFSNILKEAGELNKELYEANLLLKPKADKLKKLEALIKDHLVEELGDTNNKAVIEAGSGISYELSRGARESIDKDRLEADGLLEKYTIITPSFTMRTARGKGGK